jgi:uncharacterized protein (TIGR02996 family)
VSNLRTALEEAIAANPDDRAAHAAYADLLAEEGDLRGEFIQVQLALEDPACVGKRRLELQRREQMLLSQERDWLGPLAPFILERQSNSRVGWARGWLESVYLWWFDFPAARALVRSPFARILRQLDLCHVQWYEPGDPPEELVPEDNVPAGADFTALYALLNAPFLPHLRWLRIGEEVDFEEEVYNNEAYGQGLVELLRKTPTLEELHVLAKGTDLEGLFDLRNLTRLRTLLVYHPAEAYPLEVLADNPALAALETLRLHPAHSEPGDDSFLPREGVVALLHSPHFPALRKLHLHASNLGNEGCTEIVASGILKRLEVLDLRHGCIGDDGAAVLARCRDLKKLKHLSLAENELTEEGCDLLREVGVDVRLDAQHDPGSDQYLWSGDME